MPPSREEPPRRSTSRAVGVVVSVVVLAGAVAGGWWLARTVESPAQREANAAPPTAGPLFADITEGDLSDSHTIQGQLVAAQDVSYTLPASDDGAISVVTDARMGVGDHVAAGDVVSEVNGRPVFAVVSPFAFFRDLEVGVEGPDVQRLQEALDGLGLLRSSVDGEYGPLTAAAVRRLYTAAGYSTPLREYVDPDAQEPTAPSPSTGEPDPADGAAEPEKPKEYPYLPVSEILAVDFLPARVLAAPAVGDAAGADGATLRLSGEQSVARFTMPENLADVISEGLAVTVSYPGGEGPGTVSAMREASGGEAGQPSDGSGTPGADQTPAQFDVQLADGTPFPAEALGGSVTVTVVSQLVAEDALLVPTSAVVRRSEDDAVVVARQSDGTLREVPVTVLGSLRGTTALAPATAGALSVGDQVRVG